MALTKQPISINFSRSIDTKQDPWQLPVGNFASIINGVFNKGGQLAKRNGFGYLPPLPNTDSTLATTFNGNLTAIGTSLQAYSQGSKTWINKGTIQPVNLEVLPLVRNSTNQVQGDCAVAANGIVCFAYTDVSGDATTYKYGLADSVTGQNLIPPTTITNGAGSPKVFIVGNYFVIVFTSLISATSHLQYIAINMNALTVDAITNISSVYTPSSTVAFDGVVANNSLFLAWNGSDGGNAIHLISLSSSLALSGVKTFTGLVATIMSVTADNTGSQPVIWASFYDSGSSTGYTLAVTYQLGTVLAPTQIIASGSVANITSLATNQVLTIVYEINNSYGYDSAIPTNYLKTNTITQGGTVGSASNVVRSVGLASKVFSLNSTTYFLAAYQSAYQPSYFLMNLSGQVISRLAYSNGGGYNTLGLPNVTLTGSVAQIAYLIKDLVEGVNKNANQAMTASTPPVYSQTGVNMASFTIGTSDITTAEIGGDLHLSGGLLTMYDGVVPVEHNFHVWPDSVEGVINATGGAMAAQQYFYVATYEWGGNEGNQFRSAPSIPVSVNATSTSVTPITFTSVFASGADSIVASSAAGLQAGQVLTDSTTGGNIQTGTYITSIVGTTIGLSLPTSGASASSPGDTLSTSTLISTTVYVPTLRLTQKIASPVKIVLYRWSVGQQTFYQTTSILAPTINDTTVDYVTITDTNADSSIVGNNILYTTGGVVEDIAAPAPFALTLFDTRLWLIDSEDRNLLWFSKQVIESTPAEMSDLLTFFVPPSTAAQGSTGVMTAIAPMDDKLIVFKENAIYYINGTGPDNTGTNNNYSNPTFITATVGCIDQHSIVFMPQGLMFQSDKGIWLLGRDLSTQYIGAPVEAFTQGAFVNSAVGIPGTNQVRFTLSTGITLMYDYYYQEWSVFQGLPAVSSTLYQGLHTVIDSFGRVFQETPNLYLDGSNPVLMSFKTGWLNLAGLQGYERAYWIYLIGQYISPHKLTMSIAYDYNDSPTQATVITPDNFSPDWGGLQLWGSGNGSEGSQNWGGAASPEQWRVFLEKQRCESFQISMQESYDPSLGVPAGAGLTLSGIMPVVGIKRGYRPQSASRSVG